jgi:hypothetical protein
VPPNSDSRKERYEIRRFDFFFGARIKVVVDTMNSSYSTHQRNQQGWFCTYLCTRGILLLLVAALGLGLPVAGAPPELPSTAAGKVLAGYLEAVNSGDKAKLAAFIKAHRPDRPDALDRMLDLRWNTGGFDLYSIESSQVLNIQAVLHEREGNGNYGRMSVTVSDGDPAVITKISLVVIPPPAGAPVPERLSQQAAVAAWEAEIERAASAGKFSGTWLWAKNGEVITSGARGKADREAGIDNTLNTRFRIGSMNKMFTAVATLQLVERGKLSLNDTIGHILPDYPNTNVASKVKVRHLLSHTGGTGDISVRSSRRIGST